MRRLLGHRDARVYLGGQVVSLFGDSCLWLAMGIWVKILTNSNGAAGLVIFFLNAASLFAPISGLVVDRFPRRFVLMATNALTAGTVLLLLFVHDAGQVWLVYAVMFGYGLSNTVIGPAQSSLLTVILPADLLADANSALSTVRESLRLVAPLAGAGLFAAVGAHSIAIIDATTFVIPILSLLAVRVVEPPRQHTGQRWRAQMIAGIRHVSRVAELRHVVIAAACATAVIGFIETTTFAITANGLHRPPAFVGVLFTIQGVGAIVGGPSAAPLIRWIGEGRLMGVGLLVLATSAVLQMPPLLPSVAAGVILLGLSIPWLVVSLVTLTQRLTPPHLQGRAYSAASLVIATPQTTSVAVGAALIGLTGYRPLLAGIMIVTTLAAGYLLSRPEQRHAQRLDPPEPHPADRAATAPGWETNAGSPETNVQP